jgi:hypothetical protein
MKGGLFLLFVAALPVVSYSQNIEVAIAGGISTNGAPSGNMYYATDKPLINYATAAQILYNFGDNVQCGIEMHVLELSGASDKTYVGPYNTTIGGDNKRFVYAKPDISFCGVLNGRHNVGRGYIYGGMALGYGMAKNNPDKLNDNEAYRAPNNGNGLVWGAQAGWVVGITGKIGAYVEVAYRYMDLNYKSSAPKVDPQTDLHYHISALPMVIGIKYRLFNTIINNNYQREKGDTESRER